MKAAIFDHSNNCKQVLGHCFQPFSDTLAKQPLSDIGLDGNRAFDPPTTVKKAVMFIVVLALALTFHCNMRGLIKTTVSSSNT